MIITETVKTILEHLKTLLPETECIRSYFPEVEIEKLEELQKPIITVVVLDHECQITTQSGSREHEISIQITINKKLQNIGTDDDLLTAEIDELIDIEEKIYNEFLKKIKLGTNHFRIVADQPETGNLSDINSIRDDNCFFGAIQINVNVYEIIQEPC
jgi:hypothetical protein